MLRSSVVFLKQQPVKLFGSNCLSCSFLLFVLLQMKAERQFYVVTVSRLLPEFWRRSPLRKKL